MQPISRRHALQLGGLGLVGTFVGGAGLTWQFASAVAPHPGGALTSPELLRSSAGNLQVRLEAAEGRVRVAGRDATVLSYNGGIPGPTLHVLPGDRLRVRLVNGLNVPTNLHVHGLHVSPEGGGDNPFVMVDAGASVDYDYRLPVDHAPGLYWYHPHHHGTVADQVFGGLYGAIIVGDPEPLPVTRERVLIVSDITLDDAGRVPSPSTMTRMAGREGDLVLVNGQARPVITARPGERERWRVVNACVSRYLRLSLEGHGLQLLGIDAGRFPEPRDVTDVVLAPGNRADLLVTAVAGVGSVLTLPYDRGGMGAMMNGSATSSSSGRPIPLATFEVTGDPVDALPAVPRQLAQRDLRGDILAARRRLTLGMSMGMGNARFSIDGHRFDPERIDQHVRAGAVEEWTITNTSPMDHPLHLHVWPMQVVARRGHPVQSPEWQDVVDVPAGSDVTVRIAFDTFRGRTVYHCHILDHEDGGMMGVLMAS